MDRQEFINKWNGNGCDFDGWYGDQCVDLFNQYNQDVIGADRFYTPTTGGAADLWNDFAGPGNVAYRKIENTPEGVPQEGDVIIWEANTDVTGPAGHVAMATANCNVNEINSFDQNYPTGTLPHIQHHPDYTGVYGWLRPLKFDAPAVVVAPVEPAPAPVEVPAPAVDVPPVQPEAVPQDHVSDVPVAPATPSTPPISDISSDQSNIEHTTIVVPVTENTMESLKSQFLSKKFIGFLLVEIPLLLNQQWSDAVLTALAYLGIQGAIDHKKLG